MRSSTGARAGWRSFAPLWWLAVLALFLVASCSGAPAATVPATTAAPTTTPSPTPAPTPTAPPAQTPLPATPPTQTHPLMIELMRQQSYPGSEIVIEQTLSAGSNYDRYLTSYQSEGLKIYALLTVPRGEKPRQGWPAIVFNHGYIPPEQYRTTERYVAYVDGFARNGYIVFRPDYRGHGDSEGAPSSAYGAPGYTADVLNAVASLQRYPDADPERIGMWGHSMGGTLTLRSMVVSGDIRAGVIWAGVVAPYPDLWEVWKRWAADDPTPTPGPDGSTRRWREELLEYGSFEENPSFWAAIDPVTYLDGLSGPLQLHHGTADDSVPVAFSQDLYARLEQARQTAELYVYEEDNHNLTNNFGTAMQRSVEFFDRYVRELGGE